jgi:hypothetical protein
MVSLFCFRWRIYKAIIVLAVVSSSANILFFEKKPRYLYGHYSYNYATLRKYQ